MATRPRRLFTDGYNSFWHFVFGIVSIYYMFVIPLFILYQLIDPYEINIMVDITEFAIGYIYAQSIYLLFL